ncbi:dihydrodipicolinate synthase family protein [Nocardiopsis terrae]|uniref:4-hydroxy-tetrahydrodipicolinate synthase n=1 Tax=Nocardiopsis terrae TaxID=372655 RepID=A0ABR9HGY9_9ACTN|nr:dihydrodipicolinate synthase family protein [Nocardiopsis terrae]MBE1458293.1 4-hydroxy-tetrahydrodipicolinate synthase [Nocardiopsis terrae]GHC81276.1 dihydrodipicolinate synthase family protein [Nocardiopsis terrae]
MFTGLSAFPLTPLIEDRFDEAAHAGLITRLIDAGVDSIGALGSTGSYAYLDRDERHQVARASVREADGVPVVVGIGALRTSHVQALAEDAQQAGASAVLLAPMSYQPLTDEDVFGLYEDVTAELSVPLVVYDNPGTTHFTFSTELYARIAALPNVAAIKIPPVPLDAAAARKRIDAIRALVPGHVSIGVSGDSAASTGLNAGCQSWFSVVGGTVPEAVLPIVRAAQEGDPAGALAHSERLRPLWELFAAHGSLRVTAAIAEHLGLVAPRCLPRPVLGLSTSQRENVVRVVEELHLS